MIFVSFLPILVFVASLDVFPLEIYIIIIYTLILTFFVNSYDYQHLHKEITIIVINFCAAFYI